ncbi:MAG: hypothetical protein E6I06_16485 [Chloroflexi bacterium]|nr:MAG: hypothetical protein E6I06_16485 [Chloroflexota bacterium]
MALQEVARRVLLGHWMVIAGLVIACMAGVTVIHLREAPTYTASTRLVLDAPAPTSLTEATAIADGAKAIVTSPSHVSTALKNAGVVRDPVAVIRNITLAPGGTSGVLQLSYQDLNPEAAAAIVNALADDLIQTRLAVSPAAQRAALDDRISVAIDQITKLDQKIASLNDQLQALQVDPANAQTVAVRAQILAYIGDRQSPPSIPSRSVAPAHRPRAGARDRRDTWRRGLLRARDLRTDSRERRSHRSCSGDASAGLAVGTDGNPARPACAGSERSRCGRRRAAWRRQHSESQRARAEHGSARSG